jgi:hypothetical protein
LRQPVAASRRNGVDENDAEEGVGWSDDGSDDDDDDEDGGCCCSDRCR